MHDLNFRLASIDDHETLVEFNLRLASETEDKDLDKELVSRGVRRAFDHGEEVRYYVAETSEGVVGSLMLTREWSDWRDGWIAWLQSVYVRKEARGQGVFRKLLEFATEQARANPDVVGLRLYVELENEAAQAVYLKTGFVDPNYRVLETMFD